MSVSIRVFLLAALLAVVAGWGLVRLMGDYRSVRPYVLVTLESNDPSIPTMPPLVGVTGSPPHSTSAQVRPSASQTWVVYLVTGATRERIWAIEHYEFDYMKDGDEPLHIFGTQLEPGFTIAVYNEHGATRVSVIKKDDPPPKGTGVWQEAGTQTLTEDDDLDGAKVTRAELVGHAADGTMRIVLQHAKPGGPPAKSTFTLKWAGGKPTWLPRAENGS